MNLLKFILLKINKNFKRAKQIEAYNNTSFLLTDFFGSAGEENEKEEEIDTGCSIYGWGRNE